eukprot:101566-Rhodomonas_salina.3
MSTELLAGLCTKHRDCHLQCGTGRCLRIRGIFAAQCERNGGWGNEHRLRGDGVRAGVFRSSRAI